MVVGLVKIVFTAESCDFDDTETSVSMITEPERTSTIRTKPASAFKSAWMTSWNWSVSLDVQLENSKSRIWKTKDVVMAAEGGPGPGDGAGAGPGDGDGAGSGDGDGAGPGDGAGVGPGDGAGVGPGDGDGAGPGDGAGVGPGNGLGVGEGPPQEELIHIHVEDDAHNPSLDWEAVPVLHLATFGHQPQDAAAVQSEQDEYAAQLSAGGEEGGDGGAEPLENDAQLKTDRTGSVLQVEFATPQLILMVLRRVLAVMYRRDPVDVVRITLHPNDNVAVPPLALDNVMLTAWKLTRANVDSAARNSWYFNDMLQLLPVQILPGRK